MRIFLITDTHLGHKKLIDWGRPADFEQQILSNLEREKGDIIIHLGDVTVGNNHFNNELLMNALAGFKKKVLVIGNHDGHSDSWYYERGWDFVCRAFYAKFFGKRILFSHKPMPKAYGDIDYNIHGHTHGNRHRDADLPPDYNPEYHKELAIEHTDYKPVNLERFI